MVVDLTDYIAEQSVSLSLPVASRIGIKFRQQFCQDAPVHVIFPDTLYDISFPAFNEIFGGVVGLIGETKFRKNYSFDGSRSLLRAIESHLTMEKTS